MNRSEFEVSQNKTSQYFMFIADIKNSSKILKTRPGRREFQSILNESRELLSNHKKVVNFEDSGAKFKLIIKGDCIGFVLDASVEDGTEMSKIVSRWHKLLKETNLRFHMNSCSIPNLDKYMEYFVYLEDDTKGKNVNWSRSIENFNEDKDLRISIDLEVENFIEENFVRSEIAYLMSTYGWKVNKIKVEKTMTVRQYMEKHDELLDKSLGLEFIDEDGSTVDVIEMQWDQLHTVGTHLEFTGIKKLDENTYNLCTYGYHRKNVFY